MADQTPTPHDAATDNSDGADTASRPAVRGPDADGPARKSAAKKPAPSRTPLAFQQLPRPGKSNAGNKARSKR